MNENSGDEVSNSAYNCAYEDLKLHQESSMSVDFAVLEGSTANPSVPELALMGDNLAVLEGPTADRIVSESSLMGILETLFDSSEHIEAKNVAEKAKNPSESATIDGDSALTEKNPFVESLRSRYSFSATDNTKSNRRLTTKSKRFFENELKNMSCGVFTEIVQITLL